MLVRDLAPVAPRVRPPPIVVEALGDDVPLRRAEVDAALKGRLGASSAPSVQRQVAALLDAEGPLAIDEVDRALASLGGRPISARDLAQWQRRSDAIGRDAEGRLALNALSDELPTVRRAIRKLAEPVLRRALERERQDAASAVHRERRLAVEKVEQERAAQARRVVVRAAPLPDEPLALCLLDVASRSICTLLGPDVRSVAERLAGYDVVVGLEIRQTFALGVDPGERRIVDLGPPRSR